MTESVRSRVTRPEPLQDGHDHALVLQENGMELRMAHPFSAVPTPYRVSAAGRWWYANCAWDAFGVCAALVERDDVGKRLGDLVDEVLVHGREGRHQATSFSASRSMA